MSPADVGVVVVAYGPEPELAHCLQAVRASTGVDVDLVVVDNGCSNDQLPALVQQCGGRLLSPGRNSGFAGGCNLAASTLTSDYVVLVNSDAVVAPDALRELVAPLGDSVGMTTGSVRLADRPEVINAAGNPVHFLGTSWAGGFGKPAGPHEQVREVASASGALLATRREVWEQLGGFYEDYFTYVEDVDLSLRCRLLGLPVVLVPTAVALHHYDFSRNERKLYFLERNRLLLLLTVLQRRTLLLLLPALLLWECAVLALATKDGWLRAKLEGWGWLLRHRREVVARRRVVQAQRRRPDADLVDVLSARLTPDNVARPPGFAVLDGLLAGYWRLVRPLI